MVSRRAALRLAGGAAFGGLAGCVGESGTTATTARSEATTETATASTSPTGEETPDEPVDPSDEPVDSSDEPADWTPRWQRTVAEQHVLGLSATDGTLYATLSSEGGPSAVARVDPSDGAVAWRTELEGEAVTGSYAGYRPIARDKWGVTLTDDRIYAVHGTADSFDWTALHALDRATGEHRWSFRRERELTTRGVTDDLVLATGREFFEPEHAHDAPEQPLVSELYALDADTGEIRWSREFAGVADVAVGADAAYVAAHDLLVAVGFDGERRGTFSDGNPSRTVRAADDRAFYLTEVDSDRSAIHGLDPAGDRAWDRTGNVSEVLLDGDRLYAGGDGVLALDPDGSTVWQDGSHGKWLLLDPDRETLYTRAGGTAVGAYALPSGDALWSFEPREKYTWPVAATAETAVAEGFADGRALYAVDRATGDARKRYFAGSRTSLFTTTSLDGRVFVGDGQSTISAFEA